MRSVKTIVHPRVRTNAELSVGKPIPSEPSNYRNGISGIIASESTNKIDLARKAFMVKRTVSGIVMLRGSV